MSLDSVRSTTLSYFEPAFAAEMNAIFGSVPEIIAPNFEEPNVFPFIKFTFMENESHNAAIGRKLKRHIGLVQVDVYVEENTGSKVSNDICNSIGTLLENKDFSISPNERLTYDVSRTQEIGNESGKYRQAVRVPYHRDVISS